MNSTPKKAFVCGWPINHSRSPLIHSYWLAQSGITGSYEKIAVAPEDFTDFLQTAKRKGFCGGNITIPHKEAALRNVSRIDDAAAKIGAVNTIWLENGVWIGGNTDWIGFAANLDQFAPGWDDPEKRIKPALILGAGGAARGVIYALQQRGFSDIILANRTVATGQKLATEFMLPSPVLSLNNLDSVPDDLSLLINTTSLGMEGGEQLPENLKKLIGRLSKESLVTDIVYIPLKTEFLQLATSVGLETVDGLGMLLHQAVPGFERWFERKVEVTSELRDIIIADMEEHP